MSSRGQVPGVAGTSAPVAHNRTASLTSRFKMVTSTMRAGARGSSGELSAASSTSDARPTFRVASTKEAPSSYSATTASAKAKAVGSTGSARPLWPNRTSSHRVAPSKSATLKSLKDDMVSSTGTESSGVYSDSDSLVKTPGVALAPASRLRPPSTSSASRLTTAVVKTASKFVRRPAAPNDQSAVVDLRNENQQLRNQIDRLKYELEEKYNKDLAAAVGEKEKQLQQEMEAKEAAWRAEMETRLSEERHDAERRLAEIALRHGVEWRAAEASRNDERLRWQRTVDELAQSAKDALAEKERLEKNIRLEVENQVQAVIQRYNELKQETSSLQTVVEMRSCELRNVTQQLEMAKLAANEVPTLRERNLTLTNTIEDLQVQLERKGNEERRLLSEVAKLEAGYKEASNKIRMLASHKDQLEWRLQQRHQSPTHAHYASDGDRSSPVRVHQAPAMTSTPTETPKFSRKTFTHPPSGLSPIISENSADGENNNNNNVRCSIARKWSPTQQQRRSSADHAAGNDASGSDVDDVFNSLSPTTSTAAVDAAATQLLAAAAADPATPTIRDVTKKNDSISYVLDLGDEHPACATFTASPRLVRRPLGRSYSLRAPKKSH